MRVDILVGNIGSGKSTIARKLMNQHGSVVINMDDIQSSISCGEYGRYDNKKKGVYRAMEEAALLQALEDGLSVCIDRTNMDHERRKRFINIAFEYTGDIYCWDFGEGDKRHLNRRLANPRGATSSTWENVFDYMSDTYQEPCQSEGFCEVYNPSEEYKFHAFDFDGTIVENCFPSSEIDSDWIIESTVSKIKDLYCDMNNIIIIWSCRSGDHECQMREFLIKNNIPFDFINENPIFNTRSSKIFAHEYYDDRNQILPSEGS